MPPRRPGESATMCRGLGPRGARLDRQCVRRERMDREPCANVNPKLENTSFEKVPDLSELRLVCDALISSAKHFTHIFGLSFRKARLAQKRRLARKVAPFKRCATDS